MELQTRDYVLLAAGVLTALQAGLLFAFQVAIVPALRSVRADAHIVVMQAINAKIENPLFLLTFFGPLVLLPIATAQHWGTPQFSWLLAATLTQILGCEAVTAFANIPLNRRFAEIQTAPLSEAEAERVRTEFQGPASRWMQFHVLRTIAATTATVLAFFVCLMA